MVDTKFLIVTTLCYVGIFIVVLVVCCCAWTKYMKNEGRVPPNRRTKVSRGRRTARDPTASTVVNQAQPPAPRQYRYIGDFAELNSSYPHHLTNYTHVQHNCRPHVSRPIYPSSSNHYTLVEGYPPRNYYPASLATATDTYDIDLQMDINSAVFADTSHGGFSGDEFSDFQSSRYDSGHDVSRSGFISGDAAVLSCSDVGNSLKIAINNSVDRNGLADGLRDSSEALKHDNLEANYAREIVIDGEDKISFESDSDCAVDGLLVSNTDRCNGVGPNTPTCSAQSLTEFNDQQPEQIPLNSC